MGPTGMETRKQWLASIEAANKAHEEKLARQAAVKNSAKTKPLPVKPVIAVNSRTSVVVTDYQKYIHSKPWKRKRKEAFQHHGAYCRLCGRTDRLTVHHKTYERIGREEMRDLEILCKGCHDARHGVYSDRDAISREF